MVCLNTSLADLMWLCDYLKQLSNATFSNMKFTSSLALAAAASSASAHTIFLSLNGGAVGDGVRVPEYDGVRLVVPPRPSRNTDTLKAHY